MSERSDLFPMNAEQAETLRGLVDAANRGNGGAACRLGDMYREGNGGLRHSPRQAFRWYSRSALAGDPGGQNNLGACYEHGLGCRQSYAKAVKWYRLAAAQRIGTASMNLGYCYLRGKSLPADKEEALRLFRLAVEQGEPKAADELERLGEPAVDPRVKMYRGIRFVDETEVGKNLGLLVVGGAVSSQHEQIRPERPEGSACVEADIAAEPEAMVAAMGDESGPSGELMKDSKGGLPSRLRFVDVAEAGEEPRFMGLIEVDPKKMDDQERYCRQVEQVQKIEAEAEARRAATEDELFPIYAECGMTPDDFVPETAERFADYLARANRMEA